MQLGWSAHGQSLRCKHEMCGNDTSVSIAGPFYSVNVISPRRSSSAMCACRPGTVGSGVAA